MSGLSGTFTSAAPGRLVSLSSVPPMQALSPQVAQENGPVVATLQRDSEAAARATNETGIDIEVIDVVIGEMRGDGRGAADQRADKAVEGSASQIGSDTQTEEQKTANRKAVRSSRNNVLRCISTRTPSGDKVPSDPNKSFEDCLEDILGPDVADQDEVKAFLCDLVVKTEDRIKRQVDRTGNLLIDAAENLINGQVAQDLLQKASSILGQLDPGVVANCLGAQELIATAQDEIKKADNAIQAAADDAVAPVVEGLDDGSQAAQDFVDFADNVETCQTED